MRPTRLLAYLCLSTILLFAIACSSSENAPPAGADPAELANAARAELAEIDASLEDFERQEGSLEMGDTSAFFTAFLEDGTARKIEETIDMGDYGDSRNTYWLTDQGALIAYRESKTTKASAAESSGEDKVEFEVLFSPEGRAVFSQRTVNGEAAELMGHEIPGVKYHIAEILLELQPEEDEDSEAPAN
jgi:hypothetical protein